MGGTTQSKFAFISTTIKKKNEDLNKSKAAETEEKVKVKTDLAPQRKSLMIKVLNLKIGL